MMKELPKLVVTDIDGVWTDGSMYYDESGNEFKRFHTYDSAGVLWFRKLNIPIAICTGEHTNAVQRRGEKLKVDHIFQGVKNKLELIGGLCKEMNISLSQVAYIGDDLNDISIIREVGYSACPASAPSYIKQMVDVVLTQNGGSGVFREFAEQIIGAERLEIFLSEF